MWVTFPCSKPLQWGGLGSPSTMWDAGEGPVQTEPAEAPVPGGASPSPPRLTPVPQSIFIPRLPAVLHVTPWAPMGAV